MYTFLLQNKIFEHFFMDALKQILHSTTAISLLIQMCKVDNKHRTMVRASQISIVVWQSLLSLRLEGNQGQTKVAQQSS